MTDELSKAQCDKYKEWGLEQTIRWGDRLYDNGVEMLHTADIEEDYCDSYGIIKIPSLEEQIEFFIRHCAPKIKGFIEVSIDINKDGHCDLSLLLKNDEKDIARDYGEKLPPEIRQALYALTEKIMEANNGK